MKDEEYLKLMVCIYGMMQLELRAVDIVDDKGVPIKDKRRPLEEQESVDLYNEISYKLRALNQNQLKTTAQEVNKIVEGKLVNNKGKVNNYLLALMLYREYLDLIATTFERNRFMNKVGRQIRIYEELEGDEYKRTRRETYRVANNLFRIFIGRPQLDDDLRDKMMKRWMK